MSIDQIRTLKHAQPFRPFAILTKNGRRIHVRKAIHIALSPAGDRIAGYGEDGSFNLRLSDVASVELPAT